MGGEYCNNIQSEELKIALYLHVALITVECLLVRFKRLALFTFTYLPMSYLRTFV